MKPTTFAITAALLLVVSLGLLVFDRPESRGTPAQVPPPPPDRRITVTGEGSVRVKPDLARVSLQIQRDGASASAAEVQALQALEKVAQALRSLGVPGEEIRATPVRLDPGNRAAIDVVVTLAGSAKLAGPVVDTAVAAGASQVRPVVFDLQHPEGPKQSALALALEGARSRAETIAAATGEQLGDLVAVEVNLEPAPVRELTPGTTFEAVSADELFVHVRVRATFAF